MVELKSNPKVDEGLLGFDQSQFDNKQLAD